MAFAVCPVASEDRNGPFVSDYTRYLPGAVRRLRWALIQRIATPGACTCPGPRRARGALRVERGSQQRHRGRAAGVARRWRSSFGLSEDRNKNWLARWLYDVLVALALWVGEDRNWQWGETGTDRDAVALALRVGEDRNKPGGVLE